VVTLREAGEPIATRQIVDALSVGLELDATRRLELTRLVIHPLRDLRRDGRVRHGDIVGSRIRWELAD
jgi:hypothetical protein